MYRSWTKSVWALYVARWTGWRCTTWLERQVKSTCLWSEKCSQWHVLSVDDSLLQVDSAVPAWSCAIRDWYRGSTDWPSVIFSALSLPTRGKRFSFWPLHCLAVLPVVSLSDVLLVIQDPSQALHPMQLRLRKLQGPQYHAGCSEGQKAEKIQGQTEQDQGQWQGKSKYFDPKG